MITIAIIPAAVAESNHSAPEVVALTAQLANLLQAKKINQANAILIDFQTHNRCQEDFYLSVAALYYNAGLFKEASALLATGVKYFPNSLELHYQSALVWLKVDEIDLAEPELRTCLDMAPNSAKVHEALANLYNQREDYKAALKETEKALVSGPGDTDIWVTRGCALRNLGRLQESVTSLDTAVKLSRSGNYNIRKMRAPILERLGRYDDAIGDYLYMIKVEQQHHYQALTNIGNCYMAKKQPAQAIKYIDQGIKDKQDYIPAHRARLAALEALNDTAGAVKEKRYIKQMEEDFRPNK